MPLSGSLAAKSSPESSRCVPLRTSLDRLFVLWFASTAALIVMPSASAAAKGDLPEPLGVNSGWQLEDAAKSSSSGAEISLPGFRPDGWYPATVPGTVLTTLVNNHVYPEPLWGENNRPETIPESLAHTSYWYRATIRIPKSYAHRHVCLNFDGINYSAVVWVDGAEVGQIRGAFVRGIFDITDHVTAGQPAAIAVLVSPEPHPGIPHEHTLRAGVGQNGGITAIDGPTFLCTLGWDWIPAIRDRDTGIWDRVFLSASGPVRLKDPLVTTDLPLPKTDAAEVAVSALIENLSNKAENGWLEGTIGEIQFQQPVELAPHGAKQIRFDSHNTPALHIANPRLWWPNGYGAPNLYHLHLDFKIRGAVSDREDLDFGIRKIGYEVPGSDTLTISVNGVPVFIRGGDWGMDEALKRNPAVRLETEIRLHQLAHLNMIRNWVGQSTSEDFYRLCDRYGLMVWDEFFQPNPGDGPDPADLETYVANVRDKILRFRNHPSIVLWCARNEGDPPPRIDAALRKLLAELEPTRRYQPNSTKGGGVRSHGPYAWRTPREFYKVTDDDFKTETGSVSIPTLESIHGMMPSQDWEIIDDDWAEHDFARGNSGSGDYRTEIAGRYGEIRNLADFVRKAQMANYEAFRAMYEGRNALLFHPTTAILTWMSNPAQPSFVWQLYHYDLEPMSSYFAVMHASEPVHIQLNQADGHLEVINNLPHPVPGAMATVAIYNLDGKLAYQHDTILTAPPDLAADLGAIDFPPDLSAVHFIRLDLRNQAGQLLSTNFYWRAVPWNPDDYTSLNKMPTVALQAAVQTRDADLRRILTVTVHNPTTSIALMAHLQLRRSSGERVLPVFYSDNYLSLVPNESRTITIEAAAKDFNGQDALVVFDGWNTTVEPASFAGVSVAPNLEAESDRSPATGLPFQTTGLR
jgi:Exo-beta-D-glucosaminidase Ig-fold domain/Glycosyl hydrolases family 2/Glycosyl hydrolases family 2, sugar binding domain/Glycosyl hydrolases family 2, TIM barrel domain